MSTISSVRGVTCCPECGAIGGDRSACQALFDDILAREFGDFRYGREHRLTVDAYSLQHPQDYMRSAKSFAAHLTGMHAAVTGHAAETNRAVQRWLSGRSNLSRPDEPPARRRGILTVAHVHEAIDTDEHIRRVRAWADSVWSAWSNYHPLAQQWIEEATTRHHAD